MNFLRSFFVAFHYCSVKIKSGEIAFPRSEVIFVITTKQNNPWSKVTEQPILNQLLFYIQGVNINRIAKKYDAECYVKKFDARQYQTVMMLGVIEGYHSIREFVTGMLSNAHKLVHLEMVVDRHTHEIISFAS